MTASKSVLGVFVKQPIPGRVKTRLAASIGDELAAEIYAAFQQDVLDSVRDLADRRVIGYAPNDAAAREYFAELAGDAFDLWPQPDVGLGERMAAFFDAECAAGAEQVVLMGSDSPNLPPHVVETALSALSAKDSVVGPATDGGYYLIGFRSRVRNQIPGLFKDIDWSTHRVFGQTLDRIQQADVSLATTIPWYDVDTVEDLFTLKSHIRATRMGSRQTENCTFDSLEKLGDELDLALTRPRSD